MFQSFYIYNKDNFQTIIDIQDIVDDESSIGSSDHFEDDNMNLGVEDDSSIDSDFILQDDSSIDVLDIESIYSDDTEDDIIDDQSSINSNDSIETDDESIVSNNPMYVSSGIHVKLLDDNLYENNEEDEMDDEDLAIIIEIERRSSNYTDTFIRKIYRKKTNNYESIITISIVICTFAVILNWLR